MFRRHLNSTQGSEQAGLRPVIVVSRNAINQTSLVIVIVPLTSATNVKKTYPNNVAIASGEGGLSADSIALSGQVRAIAKSRLLRQRGTLSSDTMQQVDRALRITLDL
ncbi:MAG: type II toxin-antitoxin system PemK/MazF family toxin [Anaerolineae bacterium]|nr:type II toxin-antitoxin system PemK/MazF family toxin [Anaerolineae bacterium]